MGLLPSNDDSGFAEVPPGDYRAIRRAILEMGEFETRIQTTASQQERT
jgi:hypothetical protein